MITIATQELKEIPVFGIAGNFAEHLSQAGEDADFVNIKTEEENAPKGIFPIYLPHYESFVGTFPLSHEKIKADFSKPLNLHLEPEMCVLFEVSYQKQKISALKPVAFSAFNDCSIRKPNAKKISEKKNWGADCTGMGESWLEIDQFKVGGILDNIHIASYIKRKGDLIQYGVDSPVTGYQYFYEKLLNWMVKTLNQQSDFGPLEDLPLYFDALKQPKQIIVSLGATRYTKFGETGFLQEHDELGVFVYDNRLTDQAKIEDFLVRGQKSDDFLAGAALLQRVENSSI
jgi:hypothetical protein